MKSSEKKGILILILVSIVIIAVIYGITHGSKNENKNTNTANGNTYYLTGHLLLINKTKMLSFYRDQYLSK